MRDTNRTCPAGFTVRPLRLTLILRILAGAALLVLSRESCLAQDAAGWFARPALLTAPTGPVIRVSTADAIIEAGEKLADAGTLMIEPGVYALPRPLVLRQKRNITIRSSAGDPASVALTGKGWELGDQHDDLIRIADCDGVLIAGLTLAESRSYGIKVEAEHGPRNVRIYHCRFRNIGVRAVKGSAGRDPNVRAVKGSVRFCDFENTRLPPEDWLFGGDYIGGIDMMALEDWTFADNVFRGIQGRNGGGRAAIFVWVRSRRIVVERNWIVDCDRGISFGNPGRSTVDGDGADPRYVTDGIIQNNFISGGADGGIELWHAEGIQVWHNSIWRPERNWARGIRVGTGTTRTDIVNNLVHGGIPIEGGEAGVRHNLAGRLDGYFADAPGGNLVLTGHATEAIGRGASLPEAPYDIRGLLRQSRPDLGAWETGARKTEWAGPMRKVRARFTGQPGTLVQMGDSITFSRAFWSPLAVQPRNISAAAAADYQTVRTHLRPECLDQKGPAFGNEGSTTIRWAKENIAAWLRALNPEAAVIMFGSNDAGRVPVAEYETAVREVVEACLANGTSVILTTPPPCRARMRECLEFAAVIRRIAHDTSLPLVDYCHEILSRRPFDWDGAGPEFKDFAGSTYEVPTLISRDGVHPSNPTAFQNDFSEEALSIHGYGLRNYLTMTRYAELIRSVLAPSQDHRDGPGAP